MGKSLVTLVLCVLLFATAVVTLEDWHTGNNQLHQALNAAIARAVVSGAIQNVSNTYYPGTTLYADPQCIYPASQANQVFEYPVNPVGTLKNVLDRGYLMMSTVGPPMDYGQFGNYLVDPATGYQPSLDQTIARLVGQNYGIPNLRVQYHFTDGALGSAATFFDVLTNSSVDCTDSDYLLVGTVNLPIGCINSNQTQIYLRSDVLDPTCSVATRGTAIELLESFGIADSIELAAYVQNHPGTVIAAQDSGSVIKAKNYFPTAEVINYGQLYLDRAYYQAVADLYSGKAFAIFDNSDSTLNGTVVIDLPITSSGGFYTRYDDYSPEYAQQCTQGNQSGGQCGGNTGSGSQNDDDDGTSINFYFADMLRQT